MKTTVKNDTIIVESEVTTTATMADMLSADYGVDLTVDSEGHLILKQPVNKEDIETQIKVAKETVRDMEGTMLAKEAEEENRKVEGTMPDKEVDKKNIDALQKEAERLMRDVMAGKYGLMHIAILMENPSKIAYNANIHPKAAVALAIANLAHHPSE